MTNNLMAAMQDKGESSSYRGRTRGQSTPSYRGRGGRGRPLIEHGQRQLVAATLTGQTYKEWFSKKHEDNNPSYAAMLNEEEPERKFLLLPTLIRK